MSEALKTDVLAEALRSLDAYQVENARYENELNAAHAEVDCALEHLRNCQQHSNQVALAIAALERIKAFRNDQ